METKDELKEMKSFYGDVYYADAEKPLQGSAHLKNLARKVDIKSGNAVLDIWPLRWQYQVYHLCVKAQPEQVLTS
jgi:hypothetical protein